MLAAQRVHDDAAKQDDRRKRLEDEVQAQQRRVDRLVESMASFGNSDTRARKPRWTAKTGQ